MKHWIFCLLLASQLVLRAGDAFLVENGQPRAAIVVAENSVRMTKLAAEELQSYLARISGARLEIVTQPVAGKVHVFVGKSSFTEALKLATDGLENGAFQMASGPDWVALLGPDEDYVPIEPWGRCFGKAETARVNAEWDKSKRRHVLESLQLSLHPLSQRPRCMGLRRCRHAQRRV